MTRCPICAAGKTDVVYTGPIRMGRFGDVSDQAFPVCHCPACDTAWLDETFFDYAAADYRERVDGDASIERYHAVHDAEQARALVEVGTGGLRDRVVADVGCGGGSFLDLARGLAAETIAIEPARNYHDELRCKGHRLFPDVASALAETAGCVDVAVCFSVIEHIEHPVAFLTEIRKLLRPGGRLVISTPNRQDWLLGLLPAEYGAFFYRAAHRWYLTESSLREIGTRAGFAGIEVRARHRFGLSNLLLWLRDRRPTGQGAVPVPPALDTAFIGAMNAAGCADYLYAELEAPAHAPGDRHV